MVPHRVPALRAARVTEGLPEGGRLPQPPGPQLQSDQRGEGALGRAARGAAAAQHLGEGGDRREPALGRGVHHRVHPALHQRQGGLQAGERGLLPLGLLRFEQLPAAEHPLELRRIAQVEAADLLLQGGHVHRDPPGVLLDGAEQVGAQPRDVLEQPVVGGLAQGEVEPDLLRGDLQAPAELRDAGGEQRRRIGQGQADVGGADDLAGERSDGVADLLGDEDPAHLLQHADQRPGHRLRLGREPGGAQRAAHRLHHLRRDGLAELLPHRDGPLDPLRAAPRLGVDQAARQHRHLVEPQVGQVEGVDDLPPLALHDARISPRDHGVPGDVLGHLPVDGPGVRGGRRGQHVGDLPHDGGELLWVAEYGEWVFVRVVSATRQVSHRATSCRMEESTVATLSAVRRVSAK